MNEEEMAALQSALTEARREVEDSTRRAEELRTTLGERDAALSDAQARLAEATAANQAGQEELTTVKAALEERDADLAAATETLREAVVSYRALAATANPDIPDDLIAGQSVADIDASLERGRELVGRVRSNLEEGLKATAVPAGAPQRTGPDLSALSPREKIEYALGKEA